MRFAWTLLILACSQPPDAANPDPNCQPIAAGDCLLPWPSSFYMQADSSTATGLRVALPAAALPPTQVGKAFDVSRLNRLDGFSPATTLVVNLKARVDETKLPFYTDYSQSVAASSTVQLLRFDTGERVPLFAEVDHNALADEDQVLLIHPAVRLRPKTRYVVALQNIVDDNGARVVVAPFESLKNGDFPSTSRLAKLDYNPIFNLLSQQGVSKDALTLAWDFTT